MKENQLNILRAFTMATKIATAILSAILAGSSVLAQNPEVSPSNLAQIFQNIAIRTLVYMDVNNPKTGMNLRNELTNLCANVHFHLDATTTSGLRLIDEECTNGDESLLWFRPVGEGYVTITTTVSPCAGTGFADGAMLLTGDWCDPPVSSHSHHFAVLDKQEYFWLQQRDTGYCISGGLTRNGTLFQQPCSDSNAAQKWRICSPLTGGCWPTDLPADALEYQFSPWENASS